MRISDWSSDVCSSDLLHARLGVPFEKIRLLQGDSDELIAGGGTGGSKSIMASGAAIVEASDKVIEAGKRIAGHLLEAASSDVSRVGKECVSTCRSRWSPSH